MPPASRPSTTPRSREVTVGATGGSTSSQYPKAMNALIGTKFKIVLGYPGGNDVNLALERGEVDVRGSNSWTSWKATRPDWLAEKKINILVQIGLAKAPDLPDVPLLMDLGTNDEDRQLLRVLSASTHIGRPIFTTPETPPERVAALRKAFDTMVHDPAFIEQARREKFDIEPTTGEAMQKIVTEMMAVPKAQSERLQKIIEYRCRASARHAFGRRSLRDAPHHEVQDKRYAFSFSSASALPWHELGHVGRRERDLVEELAALGVARERIVDREHDAVDAEGLQRGDERRLGEDAAGGDPDLIGDGLARQPLEMADVGRATRRRDGPA